MIYFYVLSQSVDKLPENIISMYSCSRHIMRLSGYLLALLFLPGINFCQDFDGLLRQAKISDDSAAFYFSKAAVFAKTTHQKARYSIANSDYYQSRGKSDSAVLFARQAIAYAEKVDSTAILIHAYKNLKTLFYHLKFPNHSHT